MTPVEVVSHLFSALLIFFRSSDLGKWQFIIRHATKETNTAMKFVHTNFVCEKVIGRLIVSLTK
jgi:hypothetical protein